MNFRLLLTRLLAATAASSASAAPSKPVTLAADRPETQTAAGLTLRSRDLGADGTIPLWASDYGDGTSPALAWSDLPAGTKSLALMLEDSDAGGGGKPMVHWLAWNIDPAAGALARGSVTVGARVGRNGRNTPGYFGPHPSGPTAHHYHFQMFALDVSLNLKPGASRDQLLAAMSGHVLGKADLVGLFAQPKGR